MVDGNLAEQIDPREALELDSHAAGSLARVRTRRQGHLVAAPAAVSRTKRAMDVIVAGVLLLLIVPVMIAVALAVAVTMGKPIFFVQQRPGLGGRCFPFYKFRSMLEERNSDGSLKSDAERLTWVGRWLRAASLDELPQLWSVLRGDMSLVGPRPLLIEYLPLYTAEQTRRHTVRPGITGWAQVNGRNSISWEEKFQHDLYYVDNWSLGLDIRILLMTLKKVVKREGINSSTTVPMPRFTGVEFKRRDDPLSS